MKRKSNGFLKGLVLGAVLGVVLGSTSLVYSAIKKDGWMSQDPQFRLGYIAGFLDVVRMAKTSNPGSYIDTHYRLPPKAKIFDWAGEINTLYAMEKYADAPVAQVIAFAGPRLEQRLGPEHSAGAWMKAWSTLTKRRREAIRTGKVKPLTEEQIAARLEHNRLEKQRNKCLRGCRAECRSTCDPGVKGASAPAPAKETGEAPAATD